MNHEICVSYDTLNIESFDISRNRNAGNYIGYHSALALTGRL